MGQTTQRTVEDGAMPHARHSPPPAGDPALLEALARMPTRSAQILTRCLVERRTIGECAAFYGVSVDAFASLLARSLESLQQALRDQRADGVRAIAQPAPGRHVCQAASPTSPTGSGDIARGPGGAAHRGHDHAGDRRILGGTRSTARSETGAGSTASSDIASRSTAFRDDDTSNTGTGNSGTSRGGSDRSDHSGGHDDISSSDIPDALARVGQGTPSLLRLAQRLWVLGPSALTAPQQPPEETIGSRLLRIAVLGALIAALVYAAQALS